MISKNLSFLRTTKWTIFLSWKIFCESLHLSREKWLVFSVCLRNSTSELCSHISYYVIFIYSTQNRKFVCFIGLFWSDWLSEKLQMFDSVSNVILTDLSFVFLSTLKCVKKSYSLILNPKSIYQFGLKFSSFNKVVGA